MKIRENPHFDEMGMTQWYWRVLHPDKLVLGENTQIGTFTIIDAMCGVVIENDVMVGFGCSLLSYSSIDNKSGRVVLKKGCKVGSNSVIMPGVTIGEYAVVGANSFVNRDIPPKEVWAGTPAKHLKRVV